MGTCGGNVWGTVGEAGGIGHGPTRTDTATADAPTARKTAMARPLRSRHRRFESLGVSDAGSYSCSNLLRKRSSIRDENPPPDFLPP
ncbi:hypothetical protein DEU38_103339 [Rhodococcus sp. AG1013]|nr:hypothetical protein DEU38_103339 [Rhodococcus sp. AG1013]